jgi:transposase
VKNVYGRDCLGRSYYDRGRKATKVSALVDQSGVPLHLLFHPANKYDGKTLAHLLDKASKHVMLKGKCIHADRAYDSERCRSAVGWAMSPSQTLGWAMLAAMAYVCAV